MIKSRTTFGIAIIVAGVILPPLVWFGGKAWLATSAASNPIPDQGAIVIVFLAFLVSVAVAAVLAIVGLVLLVWPSSRESGKQTHEARDSGESDGG
jgi:formate hydrogenlyase subunit 3/multisubunit Na+/H+ antiporter MnhD subunit